jgi:hypothetical protein
MLSDPDGTSRYLGETSGATFLDHLKHFMLALVPLTFQPDSSDGSSFVASIGQYQTFDSRPLPNPDGGLSTFELEAKNGTNVGLSYSGRALASLGRGYGFHARRASSLYSRWQWKLPEWRHLLVRTQRELRLGSTLIMCFYGRWGDLSSVPPPLSSSASPHTMTQDSFRYLAYYHVCFALASSVGNAPLRHPAEYSAEAFFVSTAKRNPCVLG